MTNYILNGILGLAVGDALGYAAQGKTREILKFAPVLEMKRGLWSDDTSLTLCTLASLRENDWRLNYVDLMERFSKWLEYGYMTPEGTVFDVGGYDAASFTKLYRWCAAGAMCATEPVELWQRFADADTAD